jgi:hypothetical protein
VAVGLETARQEWEEGLRQLEAQRGDRARYGRLLAQVEVVTDELRRRVGQTYAVADLARSYGDAETWARDALSERAPTPGWARDLTMVVAASFHAYQRGAVDYQP